MHHRLSESLELKLLDGAELLDQALEYCFIDERGRPMRRAVGSELDSAHSTAQITFAHRLDLQEARERRPVINHG